MTNSKTILVYGSDPRLLETRAWVLSGAGFNVCATHNLAEARTILDAQHPSLTVLCHSLSPSDRKEILAESRICNSTGSTLVLTVGPAEHASEDHHEALNAFDGPRALIAKVSSMLRQPNSEAN